MITQEPSIATFFIVLEVILFTGIPLVETHVIRLFNSEPHFDISFSKLGFNDAGNKTITLRREIDAAAAIAAHDFPEPSP
jgi:hypothetical protein